MYYVLIANCPLSATLQRELFMPTPLSRVFEAAGCRTQTELANLLGIRQSSISDAKRRSVIPSDWLITLLFTKNINPAWILTGQAPRYLGPLEETQDDHALDFQVVLQNCPHELLLEELARRLAL